MYSVRFRIACVVSLVISLAGLLNWWLTKYEFAGLTPKQIAIILFVPAFYVTYLISHHPDTPVD